MSVSKLIDTFRLFRKAGPRKIWNGTQLLTSYYRSKRTGKVHHRGFPLSLAIEPTTACNLRCPECPSGLRSFTRPTGRLSPALFHTIIDEVKDHLLYLTFYFQGEPYLHPDLLDMVRYASSRGIYTATSTNAHFLTEDVARRTVESGLDRLIISIDGVTQETYASYRREGSLRKVLEGTKHIVAWKRRLRISRPHIIFQFLVVKPNEHEIEEVKRLGRELGVDEVRLKTAQIYDYENGSGLIPEQSRFARYIQRPDGKWALKNPLLNECWKMWHSCVITWDGKVVPCCFDKDAAHPMGSLDTQTLAEIWRGDAYYAFRQHLLNARQEIDICKNCSEGGPVWA